MNTSLKIIAIGAAFFTASLIFIGLFATHPLDAQYEETLQVIMEKGQFSTASATLNTVPELRIVKSQILKIKKNKAEISDYGRGKLLANDQNSRDDLIAKINQTKDLETKVLQSLKKLRQQP